MALTQVKSDGIADGAVTTNDLSDSGVTAGTYGSSSAIPAITVDAKGRITSATTSAIGGTSGVDFNDNVKARFGTGNDLEIYHNASDSLLDNVGAGDLYIRNQVDDRDVIIQSDNGSGGAASYIVCDGSSGATILCHYGSEKFTTTTGGIDVSGSVTCDGLTSDGVSFFAASGEYQIQVKDNNSTGSTAETGIAFVDSSNTVQTFVGPVVNTTSDFYIKNTQNAKIILGTNNSDRAYIDESGHFRPAADNTYNLGGTSNRWANIYTADLQMSNEGSVNDVDGTWGKYTIQEGENDLFLINRRTGKKYKFMLQEVK